MQTETTCALLASMSDHEGRECEIYWSHEPHLATRYFSSDGKSKQLDYIEVVLFKYDYKKHQVYVRMPLEDHYVELYKSGYSAMNDMENYSCRDVIKEIDQPYVYDDVMQPKKVSFYKHGEHAMIKLSNGHFNFLTLVHDDKIAFDKGAYKTMMQRSYHKIPDLRSIQYALRSPTYDFFIIVDASEYNFQYDTMRCFYGIEGNMRECRISEFCRYKDGGTTTFRVHDGEKVMEFYHPTPFDKGLVPTLDGKTLVEIGDEGKMLFAEMLDLNLAPKIAR